MASVAQSAEGGLEVVERLLTSKPSPPLEVVERLLTSKPSPPLASFSAVEACEVQRLGMLEER
jgi:hypothetical protein